MRAGELQIERQSVTSGIVTGGEDVIILTNKIEKGVLLPVTLICIQHLGTNEPTIGIRDRTSGECHKFSSRIRDGTILEETFDLKNRRLVALKIPYLHICNAKLSQF